MTADAPRHTTPRSGAARVALGIYQDVLGAVGARRLTGDCLRLVDGILLAGDLRFDLTAFERVFVVGAGKAAVGMAEAAVDVLGPRIARGIVVTKDGHGRAVPGLEVMEAGHPVPDSRSLAAGEAIGQLALAADASDLVICLISGGASALIEWPHDGIGIEQIAVVTRSLLRSGATIGELNTVRARLSRLKAGGLATLAAPARVLCLALSDVLGNPLEVIASGPCVSRRDSPGAAEAVLARRGCSMTLPPQESAPRAGAQAHHVIVGDIWTAIDAARHSAESRGLRTAVITGSLEGEARDVAAVIGAMAHDLPRIAADGGPQCLILGGETTVTVRGDGSGGRSQEIASVVAATIDGRSGVAVLAGGTDGTDGPTLAAGGLAEPDTLARALSRGVRLDDALARSDTYGFLEAAGGLLVTGPTHSNVGDVVIVVALAEE